MSMKHFTDKQLEVMASQGGKRGRRAEIEIKNRELIEKFAPKKDEETVDNADDKVVESSEEVVEEKPKPKRRNTRKKTPAKDGE